MKLKKKSLRLGQILWAPFTALLILLLCGIPAANAQTPQQIAKKSVSRYRAPSHGRYQRRATCVWERILCAIQSDCDQLPCD